MAAYSPSTPREEVDILASGTAQLHPAQGHEMQAQQDDGDEQLPPVGDEQDEEEEEEEEEQIEEEYESSSSPSTTTSTLTWITWFCSLPGHEYFCEVAEDFIEDDFNLTGLSGLVPFYKEAMEMVLDVEAEDESHRVPDVSIVESSAELLYGLIHQRFIITRQGLQQMYAKFDSSHFGHCPRVYCTQTKLLPCGRSDLPGVDTVKLYCPSCVDMYVPPSSRFQGVDGAFFGTTFPHLLLQTYPSAFSIQPFSLNKTSTPSLERQATDPLTSMTKVYVPRIYGFKVSERARSGPRMQWLRMRPRIEGELDWQDDDTPSHAGNDPTAGEGGERPSDIFDGSGGEDDDEEDVSEEEEDQDAAAGKSKKADPDAMKEAATLGSSTARGRPVKPLPRSSPSSAAVATLDAAQVKRDIEQAKVRAAQLVEGLGLKRPEQALLGGGVRAVRSIVA